MPEAMAPPTCRLALKEWAVTEQALARGEQILLLRKGGIREERREFRVMHPEFLIFPTYEHQREDLVAPRWRQELSTLLQQPRDTGEVVFSHWARVRETIEITEDRQVEALAPNYIWTPDYARSRLHWKPRSPLLVLLVRVYRLGMPRRSPLAPSYAGCKSWVSLEEEIELGQLTPVLGEREFQAKTDAIRAALAACGS
jgi:hypothetical protein